MVFSSEIGVCQLVDSDNIDGRLGEIHAPHSSADTVEAIDAYLDGHGVMIPLECIDPRAVQPATRLLLLGSASAETPSDHPNQKRIPSLPYVAYTSPGGYS